MKLHKNEKNIIEIRLKRVANTNKKCKHTYRYVYRQIYTYINISTHTA